MKTHRLALSILIATLSTLTFAQSDPHKAPDKAAPSEAQKSFDKLKTLAGSWVGQVTTFPPAPDVEASSRSSRCA